MQTIQSPPPAAIQTELNNLALAFNAIISSITDIRFLTATSILSRNLIPTINLQREEAEVSIPGISGLHASSVNRTSDHYPLWEDFDMRY
jgi:hypothetical protein